MKWLRRVVNYFSTKREILTCESEISTRKRWSWLDSQQSRNKQQKWMLASNEWSPSFYIITWPVGKIRSTRWSNILCADSSTKDGTAGGSDLVFFSSSDLIKFKTGNVWCGVYRIAHGKVTGARSTLWQRRSRWNATSIKCHHNNLVWHKQIYDAGKASRQSSPQGEWLSNPFVFTDILLSMLIQIVALPKVIIKCEKVMPGFDDLTSHFLNLRLLL